MKEMFREWEWGSASLHGWIGMQDTNRFGRRFVRVVQEGSCALWMLLPMRKYRNADSLPVGTG